MRCKKLFSLLACGPKKKKQILLSFSFFSLLVDYIYIDLFFFPPPLCSKHAWVPFQSFPTVHCFTFFSRTSFFSLLSLFTYI